MGNAHDDIYNHDDVDDDNEGKRGSILAGRSCWWMLQPSSFIMPMMSVMMPMMTVMTTKASEEASWQAVVGECRNRHHL